MPLIDLFTLVILVCQDLQAPESCMVRRDTDMPTSGRRGEGTIFYSIPALRCSYLLWKARRRMRSGSPSHVGRLSDYSVWSAVRYPILSRAPWPSLSPSLLSVVRRVRLYEAQRLDHRIRYRTGPPPGLLRFQISTRSAGYSYPNSAGGFTKHSRTTAGNAKADPLPSPIALDTTAA